MAKFTVFCSSIILGQLRCFWTKSYNSLVVPFQVGIYDVQCFLECRQRADSHRFGDKINSFGVKILTFVLLQQIGNLYVSDKFIVTFSIEKTALPVLLYLCGNNWTLVFTTSAGWVTTDAMTPANPPQMNVSSELSSGVPSSESKLKTSTLDQSNDTDLK